MKEPPRKRPELSEAKFQAQVIQLARTLGYSAYHTYDSRRSTPGWPDLAIWRQGRFLLAEIKGETGRLSPDQTRVLGELREAGVEVYVWRPSDWNKVVETLKGDTA